MEFKFRAVDEKSSYLSPSSGMSYFSEQAFRAGNSSSDLRLNPDLMRNPSDVREAIQLQLEKERIREEIIASEIARRRILEAEVRRELMMEREMALRRAAEGLSFEERLAMRFDPRFSLLPEERLGFSGRRDFGAFCAFDTLLLPRLPEAMVQEVKPPSEVNKDKLIILAKPDPNLSGAKRKAETQPAVGSSELPFAGLKKKPKEEWSCALCQVSATSERGLNEHLQGKKHKGKEAGLRAHRMGKNSSNALLPKRTVKHAKLTENNGTASPELGAKAEHEFNKTGEGSLQKMDDTQDLTGKDHELQKQKNQNAEDSKKKNGMPIVQKAQDLMGKYHELQKQKNQNAEDSKKKNGMPIGQKVAGTTELKKKKFKFWCEMCQIGAYSELVMETHKKGKKHLARLQEPSQTGEAVPTTSTATTTVVSQNGEAVPTTTSATTSAAPSEATQKEKYVDVVTKEANEETTENVVADANESDSSPVVN